MQRGADHEDDGGVGDQLDGDGEALALLHRLSPLRPGLPTMLLARPSSSTSSITWTGPTPTSATVCRFAEPSDAPDSTFKHRGLTSGFTMSEGLQYLTSEQHCLPDEQQGMDGCASDSGSLGGLCAACLLHEGVDDVSGDGLAEAQACAVHQ